MTKISNQYSLTNILTADLANSRLGINNVSPTVALDVTGAGKFSSTLQCNGGFIQANQTEIFASAGASNRAYAFSVGNVAAGDFTISQGSTATGGTYTTRLTISSTGNVGIGITAPVSKLQIAMDAIYSNSDLTGLSISNATTILKRLDLGYDGTADISYIQSIHKGTAYKNLALNPNGGNVGIGVNPTQSAALTFADSLDQKILLNNNANNYRIDLASAVNSGNAMIKFIAGSTTAGEFGFYTTTNLRMIIASNGNVGIGTTTILSKLHVEQNVNTDGIFLSKSGGNKQAILISADDGVGAYIAGGTNPNGTATQADGFGRMIIQGNASSGFQFQTSSVSGGSVQSWSLKMTIANNGNIGAPSGTNIYNASDVRLKKNISTTTYGLNTISALNPVKFNWVDGFEPTEDGKNMLGFIAQEVQAVLPEAVESFGGNSVTIGDTIIDNPLRVNEKFIIPVLVKAIQELSAKVSLLENK